MKAVICAYVRSPFHFARKGALAGVRPDDLAAQVVSGLLQRTDIDPQSIEELILGCAYPDGALALSVGSRFRMSRMSSVAPHT